LVIVLARLSLILFICCENLPAPSRHICKIVWTQTILHIPILLTTPNFTLLWFYGAVIFCPLCIFLITHYPFLIIGSFISAIMFQACLVGLCLKRVDALKGCAPLHPHPPVYWSSCNSFEEVLIQLSPSTAKRSWLRCLICLCLSASQPYVSLYPAEFLYLVPEPFLMLHRVKAIVLLIS